MLGSWLHLRALHRGLTSAAMPIWRGRRVVVVGIRCCRSAFVRETGTVLSAGGCVVVGSNAVIDGVLICAEHGGEFMEGDADVRTR